MATTLGRLKVVMQTDKVNSATVLLLHGSGDTGPRIYDWVQFLVGDFSFPHIKFLFPTAPFRSYTPLNGESSRVWFDRYSITPDVPEHAEIIESTGEEVKKTNTGRSSQWSSTKSNYYRCFSMGGALALHTAFRFMPGLGGVFTLSSFLSEKSAVYQQLKDLPVTIPLLMYHGERDTLIPISWGKTTFNKLTELKVKGEFIPIKNTLHELEKAEIEKLFQWILKLLPNQK